MRISEAEYLAILARRGQKPEDKPSRTTQRESDLHDQIIAHCKSKGWIYLHSRMDKRTGRTLGEPDFVIVGTARAWPRVWFVECKSCTGKLSPEQNAMRAWLEKLGQELHIVRSMDEFLEVMR